MRQLFLWSHRLADWRIIIAGAVLVGVGMLAADRGFADDAAAPDGGGDAAHVAIADMSLHQLMERMSDDFRLLKRSVRDENQRDATLEVLIDMQRITIAARLKQPDLQNVSEDQRTAYLIDYRVRLIGLSRTLLEAEQAVVEGRTSDAFDAVKTMAIQQREGHEKFKVDED